MAAALQRPTCALAEMIIDRWEGEHHKAYITCEDGTIHSLGTSSLMARWDWQKGAALSKLDSVKLRRNPVGMVFTRFREFLLHPPS
jgi:hypothetical protein